jgi:2-hydroxychromene-2-carboxylate isomerase
MTRKTLHFFFDFSSPFTYLASTQVEAVAARTGAQLRWRPMLLGAVFREIGTANVPLLAMSEAKRRYLARDLHDWAAHWGVPFRFTTRFPMKTVKPLRLALLAGERTVPLCHAMFRALWVDDRDLDDDATLAALLREQGLDADNLLERSREPAVKQALVDCTSEALAHGVFGAPTFIVADGAEPAASDLLFWGQDRLGLVERALSGWRPTYG